MIILPIGIELNSLFIVVYSTSTDGSNTGFHDMRFCNINVC